MGCGFYMLHASIQVYVTEFAPATRSSAVAFHTFSFFIGGGIRVATDLVSKVESVDGFKLTEIGLLSTLGGYFGGP
jgi:hypothetical protein